MLQYLGAATSRLLNVSSVASDLGARRETMQSRLASLDASFLVHLLLSHRSGEHRTVTLNQGACCRYRARGTGGASRGGPAGLGVGWVGGDVRGQ